MTSPSASAEASGAEGSGAGGRSGVRSSPPRLGPRGGAAAHDVQGKPVGLDPELIEVRIVDQPEDLADVVVAQH